MGIDASGLMFGKGKVKNGSPLGGVLFWNNPDGINLKIGKRGRNEWASGVTKL